MYEIRSYEMVPLWLVFPGTVGLVVLSIRSGLFIARARKADATASDGSIGSAVGATLGLLAFMLAFTFSIAAGRRDIRKEMLLKEVNAIGTTYLRADLIPEPHRSEARKLLKKYVDVRVEKQGNREKLYEGIRESKKIQDQLWDHAAALAEGNHRNPDIVALFIDSLNEMFDLQTTRVTVAFYHIPGMIWAVLAALTIVSMAVIGYQFGMTGSGNWWLSIGLAVAFSLVILLIVDLDRVSGGWLKIDHEPMYQLHAEMNQR